MELGEDLQSLIDQVRQQAVETAEAEASKIRKAAQEEADAILAQAKAEAEKTIAEAEAKAKIFEQAGEDAVQRAGRDARLRLAQELREMLDATLQKRIAGALDKDFLQELVMTLARKWERNGTIPALELALNASDLERLEGGYFAGLEDVELSLSALPSLDGGLRISQRGESHYFDFSDEALTGMLTRYLSTRFAGLIDSVG
jgi:vacuolar-type H+-ATPase subunit E/Vma4